MPNYAESHYLGLSFSKKVTSESGAYAQMDVYFDHWAGTRDKDTEDFVWRSRDFKLTLGGLGFLGEGATITTGAYRLGSGWIGQQDTLFIGFCGVGIGLNNLGGMFSIHYLSEDGNDGFVDLGEATSHTIAAEVKIPVVDVWAAVTINPTDENGDGVTSLFAGAIYNAPVMGLKVGAIFATNLLARGNYNTLSDGKNQKLGLNNDPAVGLDDATEATGLTLSVWSDGMNLAEGLVLTPALRYDMLTYGSNAEDYVQNRLGASVRLSKALNANMAIVPTLGYYREWTDASGDDPLQIMQGTLALEVGVNGQKFQLYGTVTSYASDDATKEEQTGAFDGETTTMHIGTLVTFWM